MEEAICMDKADYYAVYKTLVIIKITLRRYEMYIQGQNMTITSNQVLNSLLGFPINITHFEKCFSRMGKGKQCG